MLEKGVWVDFAVWLAYTLGDPWFLRGFLGRLLVVLSIGLCDRIVHVRAEPWVLRARSGGSGEGAYAVDMLGFYDALASAYGFPILDTSGGSVGDSFRRLLGLLGG